MKIIKSRNKREGGYAGRGTLYNKRTKKLTYKNWRGRYLTLKFIFNVGKKY